ncbi:MAG: hypothetical protein WBW71_05950 [Bacteroidota bacterium]
MTTPPSENGVKSLRQTRIFLALAVLSVVAANMIDAPYSSFGIFLNILVIVVLMFTLFRIHRFVVALKSSTSIL